MKNRKDYTTPTVLTVRLAERQQLLSGSPKGALGDPQTPETDDWE